MRKTVSVDTYGKVKKFFEENKLEWFTATYVKNHSHVDYQSAKLCVKMLHKAGFLRKKLNEYRWRGECWEK